MSLNSDQKLIIERILNLIICTKSFDDKLLKEYHSGI